MNTLVTNYQNSLLGDKWKADENPVPTKFRGTMYSRNGVSAFLNSYNDPLCFTLKVCYTDDLATCEML